MRIPYLNIPCIINETCYHGECIHINDYLIGWYEYCLCNRDYSGYECNEKSQLNRIDWFIILTCLITCLSICLCLLCIPIFYKFLKDDFYPQIIECTRTRPYVEMDSTNSFRLNGMRIYRIPSEHLTRRRTIIDGLIPLHTISSLAYLNRFRNMTIRTRNEQIHI